MAKHAKTILAAAMIPIAFGAGLWLRFTKPWESPTGRAHRLCRACGLDDAEIKWLIDAKSGTEQTREQELELFYDTFEQRAEAELCEPCAEAMLDAAGLLRTLLAWPFPELAVVQKGRTASLSSFRHPSNRVSDRV